MVTLFRFVQKSKSVYMKPDIERLMWGGVAHLLLHSFCKRCGIRDLSSGIPGKYLEIWRRKIPESKNRSGLDFGAQNRKKVDPEKVTKIASSTSLLNFRHCWPGICQFGEFHSKQLNLSFSKLSKFLKSLHWCKNCACFCEDSGFRGRYHPLA